MSIRLFLSHVGPNSPTPSTRLLPSSYSHLPWRFSTLFCSFDQSLDFAMFDTTLKYLTLFVLPSPVSTRHILKYEAYSSLENPLRSSAFRHLNLTLYTERPQNSLVKVCLSFSANRIYMLFLDAQTRFFLPA